MSKTTKNLVSAMRAVNEKKTGAYDTRGTVTRIEDGVAWVHLHGGVDETPVKLTINAKPGDTVQVRVGGGGAFLMGNATAPPTDDARANEAFRYANSAAEASAAAQKSATTASEAAAQAVSDAAAANTAATAAGQAATAAQNSLKSVVQGATTVEKAVSVMQTALEAVVDYDPQTDTTQEYFWHDAAGAHVLGTSGDYRNDIDSTGMKIVEVATEESVAEFGASGAQIGKDDESHIELDYHSMQLVDKEGDTYFHVSDLRGSDGTAAIVDTFTGNGSEVSFDLNFPATSRNYTVSVNGSEVISGIIKGYTDFTFQTAPATDDVIVATYNTTSSNAKAYTFGNRDSGSIGALSVAEGAKVIASGSYGHAEGHSTTASGYCSHAEGRSTTASGSYGHAEGYKTTAGRYSHAEGYYNIASGIHSHAEGYYYVTASGNSSHAEGTRTTASGSISHAEGFETVASGPQSHAQNWRTKAGYDNQTAIGKYNDNQSTNAFEIGNGTSDSNRSNAFAVDWNGNVEAAGDVTDGSGNVLSEKVNAVDPNRRKTLTITNNTITPDVNGWVTVWCTPQSGITLNPTCRVCADSAHTVQIAEGTGIMYTSIFFTSFPAKAGCTYYLIAYRASVTGARIFY